MLDFYKGMDISWLPQLEQEGARLYDEDGRSMDGLALAKHYGVNAIRLRIWNDPAAVPQAGGWCDLQHTIAMAKRIKAQDMEFLLDFHYSDFWADPANQKKPHEWESLTGQALENAVREYTAQVLEALRTAGAMPDMVQIGNEIRSGMLFPDGEVPNWQGLARLVNAGIEGARRVGGAAMPIMIHLDQGGRWNYLRDWFDNMAAAGLAMAEVDVIGLSYYPFWHGTFGELKNAMENLVARYGKPIIIAETAHAWRLAAGGFIDASQERIAGFAATPQGQRQVVELVMAINASLPQGMGRGIFYWEPLCLPTDSGWSANMGILDETGKPMEVIHAFALDPAQLDFTEPVKAYAPEKLVVEAGTQPALPGEVQVLLRDGTLHPRAVHWTETQSGHKQYCGVVEGFARRLTLDIETKDPNEKAAANLLRDPNWDAALTQWRCEVTNNATTEIIPEFVDPFPAPPHNAVRMEGTQNFSCYLYQTVLLPHAGRWQLQADCCGADTTGVQIYLRLQSEADASLMAEEIIHPTEHEWQTATVQLALPVGAVRAGISVVSPPGYSMVRDFKLVELPAE